MDREPNARTATLHDVAREAGVSLATASRVLNGSTRKVNEEYRQRVVDAAARLDYTTNLSAQAIVRGSTTTVALLVADIADPYFAQIAAGVVREADEDGLIVTMAATERDPERELALVRTLRGQRPRAMLLAASRRSDEPETAALVAELASYERAGGRVAYLGSGELDFRAVRIGNVAGAEALARALAGLGYRRFAVLAGPEGLHTGDDRLRGFTAGVEAAGGTIARVERAGFTRDDGRDGMQRLLERGLEGIELVFAVNDVMAMGAMTALREAGLEPGRELAVAGFDDIPTVQDVSPPLTSVRIPLQETGRRLLRVALGEEAETDEGAPEASAEVVIRASTPAR